MPDFQFQGLPKYLDEAAKDVGAPVKARARRLHVLADLTILLSQASTSQSVHRRKIYDAAAERVESLRIALDAACGMFNDVIANCPADDSDRAPEIVPTGSTVPEQGPVEPAVIGERTEIGADGTVAARETDGVNAAAPPVPDAPPQPAVVVDNPESGAETSGQGPAEPADDAAAKTKRSRKNQPAE